MRLMFLKFRLWSGFESLCREVADSITWRGFCRIAMDGAIPHPRPLMKLTTRCAGRSNPGHGEDPPETRIGHRTSRLCDRTRNRMTVKLHRMWSPDSGRISALSGRVSNISPILTWFPRS